MSWPQPWWGQEGQAGGCCICCPARCPKDLRTFLQKKQEFPPFLLSYLHNRGVQLVVQKSQFHHLLHQILPGGFSNLDTTATPPPASQSNVHILLSYLPPVSLGWEPSRAHTSPVVGRAFLAGALWESLGLSVFRKGIQGDDIPPKFRVILGA